MYLLYILLNIFIRMIQNALVEGLPGRLGSSMVDQRPLTLPPHPSWVL